MGVYDFRGRLLAVQEERVQLGPEKQQVLFTWQVADHGVRIERLLGRGRSGGRGKTVRSATRQSSTSPEPWSTRNEYQWSTWAAMACTTPSLVPKGMRLMAHAGMNALGYPGRGELYYAAERWGWRMLQNENIGMNTFAPLIEV